MREGEPERAEHGHGAHFVDVPLRGKPTFELGIGIHGVPGRERRTLLDADGIADTLARSSKTPPYTRTLRKWDPDGRGWKEVRFTSAPIGRGTTFSPS